jgi:hypothetical protein
MRVFGRTPGCPSDGFDHPLHQAGIVCDEWEFDTQSSGVTGWSKKTVCRDTHAAQHCKTHIQFSSFGIGLVKGSHEGSVLRISRRRRIRRRTRRGRGRLGGFGCCCCCAAGSPCVVLLLLLLGLPRCVVAARGGSRLLFALRGCCCWCAAGRQHGELAHQRGLERADALLRVGARLEGLFRGGWAWVLVVGMTGAGGLSEVEGTGGVPCKFALFRSASCKDGRTAVTTARVGWLGNRTCVARKPLLVATSSCSTQKPAAESAAPAAKEATLTRRRPMLLRVLLLRRRWGALRCTVVADGYR